MASCASPAMPLRVHARAQLHFDIRHALFGALEAHGAAQLFGLAAGESGGDHGHAQQLLLKQRHARACAAAPVRARGAGNRGASRPCRRFRYGCTILPTMGPGRMMATCTTMS